MILLLVSSVVDYTAALGVAGIKLRWPQRIGISAIILAGVAVVWGFYLLGKNPYNKTPGWTSIAVGGALALFGGLISGLSWVAGVGLIIGGAVSLISGLFKRKDTF